MKSAWVAVVVCVVLTTAVFAQGLATPRSMGMGGAVVGVADDAGAWFQNPAGLGALSAVAPEGKLWANDAIGAWADMAGTDAWDLTWSGWQPAKALGFGAGYGDMDGVGSILGAGAGMAIKNLPLSVGANVYNVNPDAGSDTTYVDLGLLYQFVQPEKAPIRVGLVARDLTDEVQTTFDLGVAWPATPKLLVAVDVVDVTDEMDTQFNAGVEYKFGKMNEWTARIGEVDDGTDNNLTLGAGYSFAKTWRVDAAWQDAAADDIWSVGVGCGF